MTRAPATDTGTPEIRHLPGRRRFVHRFEDGEEAYLEYRMRDEETVDLRSTFVPEEHRRQGIAGEVVAHALRYARHRGLHVVPTCPFVRAYMDDHPETADLLAPTR